MDDIPTPESVAYAIRAYRTLLVDFVTGALSAAEFEEAYLATYLTDEEHYPSDVFDVVDAFFAEVDAYVSDPSEVDVAAGDLGESDLRARAKRLLGASGYRAVG